MTCIYCKNNNMTWCLTSCYTDTFKCPNCGATIEIKQKRDLLTEFLTVWDNQSK